MCKELVRELQSCPDAEYGCSRCEFQKTLNCRESLMKKAADAIEERDRYALTLQHEMMAEAESHIAQVERLNKQIEELQKNVAYWQAQLTKSMCGETLAELEKPRWIPVTERLPENDGRYLVCNQPYKAQWVMIQEYWKDSGWSGSSVTHWMPLPEPPKEEA